MTFALEGGYSALIGSRYLLIFSQSSPESLSSSIFQETRKSVVRCVTKKYVIFTETFLFQWLLLKYLVNFFSHVYLSPQRTSYLNNKVVGDSPTLSCNIETK